MKKTLTFLPVALCAALALNFSACSSDSDDDEGGKESYTYCGACTNFTGSCNIGGYKCQELATFAFDDPSVAESYCTETAKGKLFTSESECKEYTPPAPVYNVFCQTEASSIVGEGCFGVEDESRCKNSYKGTVVASCP